MSREPTRRAFLSATGATVVGLAGCLGGGSGSSGGTANGGSSGTDSSGTGGNFGGHASTEGLDTQPSLGPAPGDATATIVAFEDPSCSRCRTFERNAFQKIKSELTDADKVTFVFRGYPVVYEWGKPTSRALEATFARSEDAFWALKDHYYAEQSSFSTENALSKTESFLESETDVDAGAVVSEAEKTQGTAATEAVQVDLDAGDAAGASVTPTLYLFRNGNYQTKAASSVDYGTLKATLGV
jgi:protein-disulfide isomerase